MDSSPKGNYSSTAEAERIFKFLCESIDNVSLPLNPQKLGSVSFSAARDLPYFPIPFKETETGAALKAVEACIACLLCDLKTGSDVSRKININLEKTTAFLCQAYMAKVGGLGKLDPDVKKFLKGLSQHFNELDSVRMLILSRHGLIASTIQHLQTHVCKSLQDQNTRRILSHPWLT